MCRASLQSFYQCCLLALLWWKVYSSCFSPWSTVLQSTSCIRMSLTQKCWWLGSDPAVGNCEEDAICRLPMHIHPISLSELKCSQGCHGELFTWSDLLSKIMYLTVWFCPIELAQVKLVQHTYSCLFGTFLCNNAKERGEKQTQERTCSVWSLLRAGNKAFKNLLYSSQSEAVCTLEPFSVINRSDLGMGSPRGSQFE